MHTHHGNLQLFAHTPCNGARVFMHARKRIESSGRPDGPVPFGVQKTFLAWPWFRVKGANPVCEIKQAKLFSDNMHLSFAIKRIFHAFHAAASGKTAEDTELVEGKGKRGEGAFPLFWTPCHGLRWNSFAHRSLLIHGWVCVCVCGPDGRAVHPRKGFGTRVGVSNHILNKEPRDGRLPDGFAAKDSRKECVQLGLHVHAHMRGPHRWFVGVWCWHIWLECFLLCLFLQINKNTTKN